MNYISIDNQQATEVELAWLAGIIDGEGYLGITPQNKKRNIYSVKPDIQIVNTDIVLVDAVVDILKRINVSPYIREKNHNVKKNPNWKKAYHITVGKFSHIVRLLTRTQKYMTGIKKAKAAIMLEFVTGRLLKGRRKYDKQDLLLIKQFNSGASETTREALKWVKI